MTDPTSTPAEMQDADIETRTSDGPPAAAHANVAAQAHPSAGADGPAPGPDTPPAGPGKAPDPGIPAPNPSDPPQDPDGPTPDRLDPDAGTDPLSTDDEGQISPGADGPAPNG